MKPGSGRLELGLSMRGTRQQGHLGASVSYDHRLSPMWSATLSGEGGATWEGPRWSPYVEILGGLRGVW
jgi:hypothetical protein